MRLKLTVALVESEKTALIAWCYLSQYLWLATEGKHGCLKSSSLTALLGRNVILFPDLFTTAYWQEKMSMMQSMGIEVQLFDYWRGMLLPKSSMKGTI